MAENRQLLKDLKDLRQKAEERKKKELVAIVCEHILLGSPVNPLPAIVFKRAKLDAKDSGRTYCCEKCASFFEAQTNLGNPKGYYAMVEKRFIKNIKSIKER